ncbi:MAG: molecular chaperone HtpG, partial [Myxococcales bacterium]|nr:molecular chaperone HtpG [Myxococcales bacterium]
HLETLEAKGYEVIFLTDTIDQWMCDVLTEYQEKPLVSALTADLDVGDSESETPDADQLGALREAFKRVLDEQVEDVRVSKRLTDSPACLVIPKGGLPTHIERLLQANKQLNQTSKRILELNPDHALVKKLDALATENAESEELTKWIELTFDQALIAEGSPISDPSTFAKR